MVTTMYEIDPQGDTIITLRNACTSFAPWETKQDLASDNITSRAQSALDVAHGSKRKRETTDAGEYSFISVSETETNVENMSTREQLDLDDAPQDADMEDNQQDEELEEEEEQEEQEENLYCYKVSSRHLMLASPWFNRAMSKEGWSESARNEKDERYHISASDWDPDAFLIIMKVIHLQNREVPRAISVSKMARIALLVDYYECGEAVSLFIDIWVGHLKKATLPSTYRRQLVLWVWVSWFFDMEDQFRKATNSIMKVSPGFMRTLDLPIPLRVSQEIDQRRTRVIESLLQGVHGLLEEYEDDDYVCPQDDSISFECASSQLGALTKELKRLGLTPLQLETPFTGLSFAAISQKLATARSPTWRSRSHLGLFPASNHSCSFIKRINEIGADADLAVTGLDIHMFK